MLSRLFVILLFVPFLLWVFLKGDILFLIFTIVKDYLTYLVGSLTFFPLGSLSY